MIVQSERSFFCERQKESHQGETSVQVFVIGSCITQYRCGGVATAKSTMLRKKNAHEYLIFLCFKHLGERKSLVKNANVVKTRCGRSSRRLLTERCFGIVEAWWTSNHRVWLQKCSQPTSKVDNAAAWQQKSPLNPKKSDKATMNMDDPDYIDVVLTNELLQLLQTTSPQFCRDIDVRKRNEESLHGRRLSAVSIKVMNKSRLIAGMSEIVIIESPKLGLADEVHVHCLLQGLFLEEFTSPFLTWTENWAFKERQLYHLKCQRNRKSRIKDHRLYL